MSKQHSQCVMAFVTDGPACNDILAGAATQAAQQGLPLIAVTVLPAGHLSPHASERLQVLYNIAERHGAELLVLFNEQPALTAAVTARQKNAALLVMGAPQSGHFIEMVKALLPEIALTVIPNNEQKVITV